MMKNISRYYYTRLDSESKHIYNSILSAWEARIPAPSFAVNTVNVKSIEKIIQYVELDNPHLFYVDFKSISVEYSRIKRC